MASKQIPESTREAARELKSQGFSRSKIARELGISERQVIRATQGRAPEERTGKGLSTQSKEVRESFVKNARQMGLSTTIRGNENYKFFKQEIQDLERSRSRLLSSMGAQEGRREYSRQRIETYYKFGLISDEQREKYLAGR